MGCVYSVADYVGCSDCVVDNFNVALHHGVYYKVNQDFGLWLTHRASESSYCSHVEPAEQYR